MPESINLKDRLPANTYIYVGRRQLRHASEPNEKQEWMIENAPEAYPHTFIDFSGVKLADVLEHAGGKQGCVVDAQKVIRDKSTLNEVRAFRKAFDFVETFQKVTENCLNIDEETVLTAYENGQPFVVLKFSTAGSKLDVPVQPADQLEKIKTEAPELYEALLANLDLEAQLKAVPQIFENLKAVLG